MYEFYFNGGMAALDSEEAVAAARAALPEAITLEQWIEREGRALVHKYCEVAAAGAAASAESN